MGLPVRSMTARVAALLSGTAMLAAIAALPASPSWASPADTQSAGGEGTGTPGRAGQAVARPGTNLLLNPRAQTGAVSRHGWDSVTIPG